MSKKHKITKRLLAFALSVAMIVTFTPTAMLSYAADDEAKAAVEEPAKEAAAPTEEAVKEEPAKEEATEPQDEVVKEKEEAEAPAGEAVEEETKDTVLSVNVWATENKDPIYDGNEHTWGQADGAFEIRFFANGKRIDKLPEGFSVDVKSRHWEDTTAGSVAEPEEWGTDFELKGTNAGSYGMRVKAEIKGSASGYVISDKGGMDENKAVLIVKERKVTVTVKGSNPEPVVYDGKWHEYDSWKYISGDPLYDVEKDLRLPRYATESAINAGTYKTGLREGSLSDKENNKNRNFHVYFEYEQGTFTILQAPLTLTAGSARHMVDPGNRDDVLTCKSWTGEGFVGDEETVLRKTGYVYTEGSQPLSTVGVADNVIVEKIDWGKLNGNNYNVTFKKGTLTVYAEDEVQVDVYGVKDSLLYNGETQSINGYKLDIDNPHYAKRYEADNSIISFEGQAVASGKEVGTYPMDLEKTGKFTNNLEGFKVTFVIHDGSLNIVSNKATVFVYGVQGEATYNGSDQYAKGFKWEFESEYANFKDVLYDRCTYLGDKKQTFIEASEGGAYAKGTDVGLYECGLNPTSFRCDDSRFDVEFVIVNDITLNIVPKRLNVIIYPRYECHDYTGSEISMKAFDWEVEKKPGGLVKDKKDGNPGEYLEEYFTFDGSYGGNNVIKGTDVGIYNETLKASKFHNNNENYDVTFSVRNKNDVIKDDGVVSKKAAKAGVKDDLDIEEKEYTSTLEILRPVIIVQVEGTTFETNYDGKEHTLKVDAETNKAYFDGVKQEGSGFTIRKVINETSFEFDESKLFLRNNINLSGTDVGKYVERGWAMRLSYDDPNVAVEFESYAPMRLLIKGQAIKLVVDDFEVTYEGKDMFDYAGQLTAHYEGLPEGEEGPAYEVFIGDYIEGDYPDGVAEQHFLDARILENTNYDIEIVSGTFTIKKRPVVVQVNGTRKVVPYLEDENGKPIEQVASGYELVCDDDLYNVDNVKDISNEKPQVIGSKPGRHYMKLGDFLKFDNGDSRFDVSFRINDGYLDIIENAPTWEIGTISLVGGTFEYDGDNHPAKLEKETVVSTSGPSYGMSFKIKLDDVKYEIVGDENGHVDIDGPFDAGEYQAQVGSIRIFSGDQDVTDICHWTAGDPATIKITPKLITVKVTGDNVKMVYAGKPVEWRSSATIEILDPRSEDPDETGYPTKLDTHGITLAGGTAWPIVVGEKPGETYDMGLVEAQEHNHFVNNNPNYNVTQFIIEEGYMELVGEEAMFEIVDPTPVDDPMYTYDGKPHPVVRDFKENNKGTFELKGDDGNTYSVQMSYPRFLFKAETVTNAGEYTWYRTLRINKVVDAEGLDVTALVTNDWKDRSKEFQGIVTVKSIEADVKVKGDKSKIYGDPDPDTSTWVDITAPAGISTRTILNELDIYRVPGENVGRYEIRVDHLLQFEPVHPDPPPGEAAKEEDIPAAAKKAAKASKASKEYEVADAAESASAEIAFKEEKALSRVERDNVEINIEKEVKFFTINKAKLTITANDNEKDYGKKDPTLTATVSKGLVGSETLPKDFYSIYRDKGEDVKMRPDYYTIHVKAPNKDVDWDAETHRFKDYEEPIPFDPPPAAEREDAERPAVETLERIDYEEALERVDYAKEDVAEYYAKEAVESEYAAKAMKAAKALAAKAVEVEATESKERIDFFETIPEVEKIPEYAEVAYDDVAEEAASEIAEEAAAEAEAEVEWVEKPYITGSSEFNLLNYEVVTENGKFNINGKKGGGNDADDNDGGNPTPAPGGGNDNGNGGVVTADNNVTTVTDNAAPTTTITDNAAPTSGNAFWALINLICMLLTALLSLIMLVRYFGKRREEDEETGEEREIKRKGLARLASLIPAIGAIIAFILTEDMSLPMILVDKWTIMMVVILAIQVGVAILAKVKKEDAEEEAA